VERRRDVTSRNKKPRYLNSIGRQLSFAMSAVDSLTAQLLSEYDLSPIQWVALSALWRQDGVTLNVLADYMRATASATSRLLGRMEERGLIERRTVKDNRRIIQIWLTKRGKELDHLKDLHKKVNARVLDGLSAAERKLLANGLERIASNAVREVERVKSLEGNQ
jgi:DNA-binding MarR family transcriptional regulator